MVGALFAAACSGDEYFNQSDAGVGGSDSGRDISSGGQAGVGGDDASGATGGTAGDGGSGQAGTGGALDAGGAGGTGGALDAGGADTGGADSGPPSPCSNNQKDPGETDVDCGGDQCPPCGAGLTCVVDTDCASQRCGLVTKTCSAPTCTDAVKNGNETDVDCGGSCAPCASDKNCLQAKDCLSGVCSGTPLKCQTPTCADGIKNGNETDVDCGGISCTPCPLGRFCNYDADCTTNVCGYNGRCGCPAGMIMVPPPIGTGVAFCIDAHEVTYADYIPFYNSNLFAQTGACAWKTDYTPYANWPPLDQTLPIRDVDWCEAYGYCSAMGKRLCGRIGGGPGDYGKLTDPTESQWFDACSAQGLSTYPYGSTFDATLCNGSGYVTGADGGVLLEPVSATRASNLCRGGEPNLLDMSGNVAEWTDECQAASSGSPRADTCRVRGGSFQETGPDLACAAPRTLRRDAWADDVGFRCCLD